MPWLLTAILSYFFFAIASLGDKYILSGPPNPKTYVFYAGVLGILAIALIPFVGFFIPNLIAVLLCLLTGAIYIFSLLGIFEGLEKFEASRIIPAIGGFSPLFVLILGYFFSGGRDVFSFFDLLAFLPLIAGSVLISLELGKKISFKGFKVSVVSAFLLALFFVLAKYVYLEVPFWTGFIWIRIGAFITALLFIFTKEIKSEIFSRKFSFGGEGGVIFVAIQTAGALASILQNLAIDWAGIAFLPIVIALQGVQYVFLFVLAILISSKFPNVLQEKFSKKLIFQKMVAIFLICIGMALLVVM
jgi:drug/metabolite transporter (DMT)-like permease